MKLPTLLAIRAIVATHAQYPARLLAAIDEDIERERACQPGTTPMQFEEEESMMGAQIKTTPGAALVTPIPPEGLAINELDRSSDD